MKYAIVSINGNQYKVSEGEELLLEGTQADLGKEVVFGDVVLIVEDKKVLVGTPLVRGAKIVGKVTGYEKGKKLLVLKYRAKSRYRKRKGHRAQFTKVKIEKISTSK